MTVRSGGDDSGDADASSDATSRADSSGDDGSATGRSDASSCTADATISGVTGQMGNARQYAVHVPTGYTQSTPVPALFCIHGLEQNPVPKPNVAAYRVALEPSAASAS